MDAQDTVNRLRNSATTLTNSDHDAFKGSKRDAEPIFDGDSPDSTLEHMALTPVAAGRPYDLGPTSGSSISDLPESLNGMIARFLLTSNWATIGTATKDLPTPLSDMLYSLRLPEDGERYVKMLSTIRALALAGKYQVLDCLNLKTLSIVLEKATTLNGDNLSVKLATFQFVADFNDLYGFGTHDLEGCFWSIIPALAASCARSEPGDFSHSHNLLKNIRQEKLIALNTIYSMLETNDSSSFILLTRLCLPVILPSLFHESLLIREASWDIILSIHELEPENTSIHENGDEPILGLDLLKSMSFYLTYGDFVMPASCKFTASYMRYAEQDMRNSYSLPPNIKFHKTSRVYAEETVLSGEWYKEWELLGSIRCDGCRKSTAPLTACSRCSSASYCSSDCEKSHVSQHQLVCRSTVSYIKELTEPRNPFRKIRLHYDASLQMLDRRLKSWIAYHHISIALTTIRKLQSLEKTACFSSHIVRFIVRPCDDQGKGPVNSFQIVKIVAADLSDQTGLRPSWIEGMHLLDSMRRHTSCARMRDMFLVLTGAVIECPPLDIQILPVETVRREDIPFVPESICLVEATDGI